jgi:hypothetical protein
MKKYPEGKYIHMLAYSLTEFPSKQFESFPKNVVIEMCQNGLPEYVRRWKGRSAGTTVYHYWYDDTIYGGFVVRATPAEAADMIRFYAYEDVRGIYAPGGGYLWGLMGPTYYVTGRMMGDPKLDDKALVREYCDGIYGAASKQMQAFFDLLWQHSDLHFERLKYASTPLSSRDLFKLFYPPEQVRQLDGLLRKAEAAAATEREQNWVRMTRDEFDYFRLVSNALYLYDGYQVNKDAALLAEVRKAVGVFDEYRKRIISYEGDRIRDYFPGHGLLCMWLTSAANGLTGDAGFYDCWRDLRAKTDVNKIAGSFVGFPGTGFGEPFTLDFQGAKP